MRAYVGTRLFRIAGHPVYGGLSGNVHFSHGGLAPYFWFGFLVVPLILGWCLR